MGSNVAKTQRLDLPLPLVKLGADDLMR